MKRKYTKVVGKTEEKLNELYIDMALVIKLDPMVQNE